MQIKGKKNPCTWGLQICFNIWLTNEYNIVEIFYTQIGQQTSWRWKKQGGEVTIIGLGGGAQVATIGERQG
jgi:hypothetical protein